MSLILVVEKDAGLSNRIASTLRADGYSIDTVTSCDAGLQHAAMRSPSLVMVSGVLPGAAELLGRYSGQRGGPGSVVLVPAQMAGELKADQFQADHLLPSPPPDGDLRSLVHRLVPTTFGGPPEPPLLPNVGAQLTSQEIFGDVLAEVEADAERHKPAFGAPTAAGTPTVSPAGSPPRLQVPSAAAAPPTLATPTPAPQAAVSHTVPTTTPPAAPQPAAPQPAQQATTPRQSQQPNDDIDRKLEETLSGFFPDKLRKPAKEVARPKRAPAPSADEIDDLLDKTLSSLELPSLSKKPRREVHPKGTSASAGPPPAPTEPPSPYASIAPGPPAPTAPPAPPHPAPTTSAPASTPVSAGNLPPSPPPFDLQSPMETIRLDGPLVPDTDPGAEAPLTPEAEPAPSQPPGAPTLDPFGAPSSDLDPMGDLSQLKATGTFDLPAIEPLEPDPPSPSGSWLEPPIAEMSPGETASAQKPAEPWALEAPPMEPTTPAPEDTGAAPMPPLPAADGWSTSSFDSLDTPSLESGAPEATAREVSAPMPVTTPPPRVPSSFTLHDDEPDAPPPPTEYPTDFTDAFSLEPEDSATGEAPVEAGPQQSPDIASEPFAPESFTSESYNPESFAQNDFAGQSFSPDPTETIDPEDTEGLQRTLDNVLQIRDGAAAGKKAGIPFGDYRLLERVAVGGMAEVWRAQRRGVEGFQKTVAIKKILSHLTGSHDFVTMFIDEAKLAAQLNHANIIQIYDLGKVDDDFFIAMEFVDGRDLRSIQNRFKELGERMPLGLCLVTVAALARALDYAHRKRDFDNRALGLVHRDVSPQNVLISYEGEIKLCDFGIVKAVAKASTTQMGALKGKLQYMSPEQAWGKEVDARSDIFSLGSVLFETLTGERLFTGDSEIGVLDAVRDCRIRSPRSLDPAVPPEVDAIVMKALAKTPETRYQTAGEMERDIAAALENLRPAVGQGDLAALMERLFGPRLLASAEQPPTPTPLEPGLIEEKKEESEPSAPAPAEPAAAQPETGKSSRTWWIAAIVLLALAAVVAILFVVLGDKDRPTAGAPGTGAPAAATPAVTTPAPSPGADTPAAAPSEGATAAGAGQAAAEQPEDGQPADGQPADGQPADSRDASGTAADGGTPQTGPATDATDGDPGSDSESTADGDESAAAGEDDVQRMIQEALDSERQKMAEDFEARKRQLEEELAKVQESNTEEGDGGGDG